jgi:trimethylamine--corrinoid protein Co-methyltransferase
MSKAQELFNQALEREFDYDFVKAKEIYGEIMDHFRDDPVAEKATFRLEDMDDLIAEKEIYTRIDENGKQVLTEIGLNIGESPVLMDLLMAADAIDFDNETAPFVPLKREYVDRCLEQVPRKMPGDPGLNTFGTGATPPFLKRKDDDDLRSASRAEFEEIVKVVAKNQDAVGIFSLPVANDKKSISLYEVAKLMEGAYPGLKMTTTKGMSDEEITFLTGKDHWVDGTSLITSLAPMETMIEPFLRTARAGNNLLLLDLTIAGMSGAGSPESLLTQIHAQVMFMMIVAQTVKPGIFCMHGGIPGVLASGDLSYSSPYQPLINAAMARVNTWITKFPSAQSGGSTTLIDVGSEAVSESELSRNTMRKYGVHVVRHAMGVLGSLNFFSLEKFEADCERERQARAVYDNLPKDKGVIPMYFPADDTAVAGIQEIAEKGNPRNADHTLRNVDSFRLWEDAINQAAKKKLYYPQISDTVIESIGRGDMIP